MRTFPPSVAAPFSVLVAFMYSSKILLINDDTYKWLIILTKRLINDDTVKTEYQTLAYTEHIHQRSCRGVVHNMIGLIGLFLISLME